MEMSPEYVDNAWYNVSPESLAYPTVVPQIPIVRPRTVEPPLPSFQRTTAPAFVQGNVDKEVASTQVGTRKVLETTKSKVGFIALQANEAIEIEGDQVEQFIRIERGHGIMTINGREINFGHNDYFYVMAGVRYRIFAGSQLKIFTMTIR